MNHEFLISKAKINSSGFLLKHFLGALLVTVVIGKFLNGQAVVIPRIEFVLDAIITCASTLVGFILTSLSIIFGLVNTELFKTIYKTNAKYELNLRYIETMVVGIGLIISCIVTGANTNQCQVVPFVWLIITVFFTVFFLIGFGFNCYSLIQIILYAPISNDVMDSMKPSRPEGPFRLENSTINELDHDTQEP